MSPECEKLLAVLPPPKEPVPRVDWKRLTAELGFALPDDYRWFCDTYGPGTISKFAWIFHPWHRADGGLPKIIAETLPRILDFLKDHKDEEDPCDEIDTFDFDRLIPFGGTDNGDLFVWIATGEPSQWRVLAINNKAFFEETGECGVVRFLLSLVTRSSRLLHGDHFIHSTWFESPQFIPDRGEEPQPFVDLPQIRNQLRPVEEYVTTPDPLSNPTYESLPLELRWDRKHRWTVQEFHYKRSRVTIHFAGPNPTTAELMALRRWVPELSSVPPAALKARLAGKGCYPLDLMKPDEAPGHARWLEQNGLRAVVEDASYVEIIPFDATDENDWIIPDPNKAKAVAQAMRAEGIKVKKIKC